MLPQADGVTITRDELIRALRRHTVTLLDVLSPESFAAAHIPGAVNLPIADIGQRIRALLPNPAAAIVTYCGGPS